MYSRNAEEHAYHFQIDLQTLRDHELYAKFSKYELWLNKVVFLRHVVSGMVIFVDPRKMEAIVGSNPNKIRSFLGLARYYKRFVKHFSLLFAPLTRLTQERVKFEWDEKCEQSFSRTEESSHHRFSSHSLDYWSQIHGV